jgi:hypothetical protein
MSSRLVLSVVHVDTTCPDLYERESFLLDNTRDLIGKFRDECDLCKKNQFFNIITKAFMICLVGMSGFCLDIALHYIVPNYQNYLMIFLCNMYPFVNCRYLLYSTEPLDILDVDVEHLQNIIGYVI